MVRKLVDSVVNMALQVFCSTQFSQGHWFWLEDLCPVIGSEVLVSGAESSKKEILADKMTTWREHCVSARDVEGITSQTSCQREKYRKIYFKAVCTGKMLRSEQYEVTNIGSDTSCQINAIWFDIRRGTRMHCWWQSLGASIGINVLRKAFRLFRPSFSSFTSRACSIVLPHLFSSRIVH